MVRAVRGLLTVLGVLAAGAAGAQPPEPAPAPLVVTTLPHPADLPPLTPPPPPDVPPLPPPPAVCPADGPVLVPLAPAAQPGWFGVVEFGLLFPHVKNRLQAPVPLPEFLIADPVRTPAAELDATIAPLLTLGYRLRDDRGALLLTYRNLASEGREVLRDFDPFGDGLLRSRLDLNTVGLAYATAEQPLGALWGLRWEVGAKLSTIFFDSRADGLLAGLRTSNHFVGAGPTVALDVARELPPSGLALYTRAEAAGLLGHVRQRFAARLGDPVQPFAFGWTEQGGAQGVPAFALQAGLSWLSHPSGRYRLTAGYQFEQYWNVGKLADSTGDVRAQGLFLRTEVNY